MVEHFLELLASPSVELADGLEALSSELGWATRPVSKRQPEFPYGLWARVVAAWCRDGVKGLAPLAGDRTLAPFVIALGKAIRSRDYLAFLVDAFAGAMADPVAHARLAEGLAAEINLMTSFAPKVVPEAALAARLRDFLERLAKGARNDNARMIALCALREVGDPGTIALIDTLPPLKGLNAGMPAKAKAAIRRRYPAKP